MGELVDQGCLQTRIPQDPICLIRWRRQKLPLSKPGPAMSSRENWVIKDGGCVASPTEPIRLGRWRRQKSVRIQQPSSAFLPTPGLNITHQWKTVCPQRRIRMKAIDSSDYVKGWFQSDCQKLLEPEDFIYIFSFSNLCKLIIKIFCVVLFQITT